MQVSSARLAMAESTTEAVHLVEDYEENFVRYRLTNGHPRVEQSIREWCHAVCNFNKKIDVKFKVRDL